jgi:hypothetical protein
MLLVYGRAFYQIVGEMREVESIGQVWLPTSFQCRPPSAMWVKRKRGRIVRFQQKYSPFVRFRDFESGRTFRPSKQTFAPEEILYFEYPFGTPSPVNEALKLIPKLLGFMYFSLAQSRGGAYPENHNFPVEKARFRTFREEKREYDIARAKVGKIFCCPVTELSDIRITEYYDVYQRVRFVERLQALRRYLVDEFNAQVLSPLAVRNGWSYEPSLKLQGFWEEAEIDAFYNEFLVGKVERAEFLKELYRKCIDGLGEAGSSE